MLGDNEVSVKSVVQRGIGDDARLVMVVHECLESRFSAALEAIGELDVLRSPPRSIRVIEEEFVCDAGAADRALPRPAAARARRPGRHA